MKVNTPIAVLIGEGETAAPAGQENKPVRRKSRQRKQRVLNQQHRIRPEPIRNSGRHANAT